MASVNGLSTFFNSLISDVMLVERQPLTRLQNQLDTLNTRKNVYSDVKSKLEELQSAVKALKSVQGAAALKAGRTAVVSNAPSGMTVLTASASSGAVPGAYQISNITLAKEQRVRSDPQAYADQALGYAGTIVVGGDPTRSIAGQTSLDGTVTAFTAAGTLASGQAELGTGSYYVEIRHDETAGDQFRLVDAEGNAASIRSGQSNDFTSGWQAVAAGVFDTGRGLAIEFGGGPYTASNRSSSPQAARVDYRSLGTSIEIKASDSLNDIASKINSQKYPQGNAVAATVVDRQLVLSTAQPGENRRILASGSILGSLGLLGDSGAAGDEDPADGFKHTLQTGSDASFLVNGVQVRRSQNSGLANVISGVTLNLAADAAGKSATLTIQSNWTGARALLDTFVEKFNGVQDYLEAKTSVTRLATGDQVTYTRGALAEDNIFSELRGQLFATFINSYQTNRSYTALRQVGINIDDNLRATISDTAKLEAALQNNPDDVTALVDAVAGALEAHLGRFTGAGSSSGYIRGALSALENEVSSVNGEIARMNTHLSEREAYYTQQYAEMQAQLYSLSYTQQMWSGIYGTYSQQA